MGKRSKDHLDILEQMHNVSGFLLEYLAYPDISDEEKILFLRRKIRSFRMLDVSDRASDVEFNAESIFCGAKADIPHLLVMRGRPYEEVAETDRNIHKNKKEFDAAIENAAKECRKSDSMSEAYFISAILSNPEILQSPEFLKALVKFREETRGRSKKSRKNITGLLEKNA
jgi:hypothetical protein